MAVLCCGIFRWDETSHCPRDHPLGPRRYRCKDRPWPCPGRNPSHSSRTAPPRNAGAPLNAPPAGTNPANREECATPERAVSVLSMTTVGAATIVIPPAAATGAVLVLGECLSVAGQRVGTGSGAPIAGPGSAGTGSPGRETIVTSARNVVRTGARAIAPVAGEMTSGSVASGVSVPGGVSATSTVTTVRAGSGRLTGSGPTAAVTRMNASMTAMTGARGSPGVSPTRPAASILSSRIR